VNDVVCSDCGGDGWIDNHRGKIAPVEVFDCGVVDGDAEVQVQKWIMAYVSKKFKNDEQKVGAFFRFARAYGRQQCDAKEFYFYMQDVFTKNGAAELTPKLALIMKQTELRMELLKVHQGMTKRATKEKKTLAELQKNIFQHEQENTTYLPSADEVAEVVPPPLSNETPPLIA